MHACEEEEEAGDTVNNIAPLKTDGTKWMEALFEERTRNEEQVSGMEAGNGAVKVLMKWGSTALVW